MEINQEGSNPLHNATPTKGILKDAIRQVISETAKESGVEIQFIDSPTRVIKTAAQAKYDDVRRVERGYVQGVHKARKEAAAPSICRSCKYGTQFGSGIFCNWKGKQLQNKKSKCKDFMEKGGAQ